MKWYLMAVLVLSAGSYYPPALTAKAQEPMGAMVPQALAPPNTTPPVHPQPATVIIRIIHVKFFGWREERWKKPLLTVLVGKSNKLTH